MVGFFGKKKVMEDIIVLMLFAIPMTLLFNCYVKKREKEKNANPLTK